jgi:hypothetical protein
VKPCTGRPSAQPKLERRQTLLSRPTTRPSTVTSLLRIGSIASFSG